MEAAGAATGAVAPQADYLIPLERVTVEEGPDGVIGQGALGVVRRGIFRAEGDDPDPDGGHRADSHGRALIPAQQRMTRPVRVALKGLHMLRTDAASVAAMGGGLTPRERGHVLQTFWRECELLHRAQHDNIVPFVGVVMDDTLAREPLYLASEYVCSGTLHELIHGEQYAGMRSDGGYLPLEVQLEALEGLFAALAYLAAIPMVGIPVDFLLILINIGQNVLNFD